ncbi:MAG: alanine racemase [Polyangiaceae bacterium]
MNTSPSKPARTSSWPSPRASFSVLDRFGANADILLGRPMPAPGARRLLKARPLPARGVKWLIDTKERLLEYLDLATSIHHRLSVAIEIDVGLHRGGARTTTELLEMLAVIADNPSRLRFVGFMGYEGHVPFAPPGFDSDAEFAAVQARYADFVQAGSQAYPALFEGPLVLNSGGSATHYRYGEDLSTVVNDIALGSAFLLPGRFADLGALGFVPALFAASPVLKKVDPAEVPFAPGSTCPPSRRTTPLSKSRISCSRAASRATSSTPRASSRARSSPAARAWRTCCPIRRSGTARATWASGSETSCSTTRGRETPSSGSRRPR